MKRFIHIFCFGIISALLLVSCTDESYESQSTEEIVEKQMSAMSLREKVGQMFCVSMENFSTPDSTGASKVVTAITDDVRANFEEYPAGGIILYGYNLKSPEQVKEFVPAIKTLKNTPFVGIDEEGGRISRLANKDTFNLEKFPSMTWLCQNGGATAVYNASSYIASYLSYYGFDVDFAPVADVNSNPQNPVIGTRAFSSDPDSVATMVCSYLDGLATYHITGCIKHYPGHGDTSTDTHLGYASTQKTWDDMLKCEMIPFKAGINKGVRFIMSAHITAPNVDRDSVPSTLSKILLTDKLRGELGYRNIIITDGMAMGAIVQNYTSSEAAIKAFQAGVDIVLDPKSYKQVFDDVMKAVENGDIPMSRINESVRRILMLKATQKTVSLGTL